MPATPAAQSDAVHDDTLIEWFLSLTPAERLAELESRLAFFYSTRPRAKESREGCMNWSDTEIWDASRERIARVFGVSIQDVRPELVFGADLQGRAKTHFSYGPRDHILHDVRDVASRETLKAMNAGAFEICTVEDYCNHMVQSYRTNPKAVVDTLELSKRQ